MTMGDSKIPSRMAHHYQDHQRITGQLRQLTMTIVDGLLPGCINRFGKGRNLEQPLGRLKEGLWTGTPSRRYAVCLNKKGQLTRAEASQGLALPYFSSSCTTGCQVFDTSCTSDKLGAFKCCTEVGSNRMAGSHEIYDSLKPGCSRVGWRSLPRWICFMVCADISAVLEQLMS